MVSCMCGCGCKVGLCGCQGIRNLMNKVVV